MTAHAQFGASNSKRRMACPGSMREEARFPDTTSVFAELGTAAHALGEHCLLNDISDVSTMLGQTIEKHEVDANMVEAVQVYVDFVLKTAALERGVMKLEQRFSLAALAPPMPMFGTSDCTIYGADTGTLWVIDYKHGQGVAVDVEDNAQLKYYALGAALKINEKAPINVVETVIVQPRAMHRDGPVRRHAYTLDDILDFGTELIDAAHAALRPDAPLFAGDHCKFCKAAGTCSALRSGALAVAQDEFGAIRTVEDLTPTEIAEYLDKIPLIEEWIKSIKRHAHTVLDQGGTIPGFKLVDRRPVRRWKNDEEFLEWAASEGLDDDDIYEKKMKSVAQIEKVVGKKNIPATLVMSVSSGVSMVPDSDNRPAVALLAADEFDVN